MSATTVLPSLKRKQKKSLYRSLPLKKKVAESVSLFPDRLWSFPTAVSACWKQKLTDGILPSYWNSFKRREAPNYSHSGLLYTNWIITTNGIFKPLLSRKNPTHVFSKAFSNLPISSDIRHSFPHCHSYNQNPHHMRHISFRLAFCRYLQTNEFCANYDNP